MKTKSKASKANSPSLDEARIAVTTADAGLRDAKAKARSAKSALKKARKASKRADKAVKKARKEVRRARKQVKTLLARQVKQKTRTATRRRAPRTTPAVAAPPSLPELPMAAMSAEVLGEHR